ncbi:Transmembrane and TPR repeat-containing protein 2 [Gryllus bimaculatus]|nr:Transmembrane and TPR repeat-containing protein 2 [Gryllus bimaculatus]
MDGSCDRTVKNALSGDSCQFLLSQRRPAEAAPKLLRALALTQPEPPLYEDAVNAATALRLAGDLAAAEEHYRLAVRLRPQVRAIDSLID